MPALTQNVRPLEACAATLASARAAAGARRTISRCCPRSVASCSVVASFSSSPSGPMIEKRPAALRCPAGLPHAAHTLRVLRRGFLALGPDD